MQKHNDLSPESNGTTSSAISRQIEPSICRFNNDRAKRKQM